MRGMGGMGRIVPMRGSKNWWITYNHRGKENRESCGSPIRTEAEKLLKHRLREIGADMLGLNAFVGPQQDRLLGKDLLDELKADFKLRQIIGLRPAISYLYIVRRELGDLRAVKLTTATVNDYFNQRLEEKRKPATINRETAMLRAALRLAFRRRQISSVLEIPKTAGRQRSAGFLRTRGIRGRGRSYAGIPKGLCSFRLLERLAQVGALLSVMGGRGQARKGNPPAPAEFQKRRNPHAGLGRRVVGHHRAPVARMGI